MLPWNRFSGPPPAPIRSGSALRSGLAVHVIEEDLPLPILAVDVDLDAARPARAVVGQRHVMPLVQTDRLLGLHDQDAFIDPLGHVVVSKSFRLSGSARLPALGSTTLSLVPGHDRARRGRGIDPRGHRVRVVVGHRARTVADMAVKPGDIAALNEALAIEARRLADRAGHKLRVAILNRGRARAWPSARARQPERSGRRRTDSGQPARGPAPMPPCVRPVQRPFPFPLRLRQVRLKLRKRVVGRRQFVVELLQLRLLLGRGAAINGGELPTRGHFPCSGTLLK